MTGTISTAGDIQAAIEAGRLTGEPHRLDLGGYYIITTGGGGLSKIDLTGDDYRTWPRRKTGTIRVADTDSFTHYWAKHADGDSEIYADRDQRTITAVLDAHRGYNAADVTDDSELGGPRWGKHRLVYQARLSLAWLEWAAHDDKPMTQERFAEFIEDNRRDIHSPDAATMLEIVQTLEGHTKANWTAGIRLADGTRKISWMEEADARAGSRGDLTIPDHLELRLPVFDRATHADQVIARFRYRITQGGLALLYKLDRPQDVATEAFEHVTAEIAEKTTTTVMRGQPPA